MEPQPPSVRYATSKKPPVNKRGKARHGFMDTEVWNALNVNF